MNETIKDAFYKTLSSCQGGIGGHVLARWHARFGMPLRATLARKFARAQNTSHGLFAAESNANVHCTCIDTDLDPTIQQSNENNNKHTTTSQRHL